MAAAGARCTFAVVAAQVLLVVLVAVPLQQVVALGHGELSGGRTGITPIQKVLQMLEGMLAKGKEEKHTEEVEFAKFHEWCDAVKAEKTKTIDEENSQITQLGADILKAKSDAEVLGGEVAELQGKTAKEAAELKTAKAVRDKEHADYMDQHQDYSESIDACQRAVMVLRQRTADVPQSLAQVRSLRLVPDHAKRALESFLSLRTGGMADAGAPEANAYEFQSGGVIDMLEKLVGKFTEERLVLEKAEMNAKASYEVLAQQLTDNMKADKAAANQKTALKAKRLGDAADAEGDLSATEKAKADDERTLADTKASCHAKSEEYEKNQVVRAEEVKAIEKATEILSSASVAGAGQTYLPSLLQAKKRGTALALLRSVSHKDAGVRQKAAAYLQARSEKLGSRYLSVMASHVTEDPFGKVKKMIKDLIVKLMEQSNGEADHHAYCTTELATNKQTRAIKAAEVEELQAQVDSLTATIAQLTDEIRQLSDAIAEIKGQQAEATTMRAEEKATNAKTVADAKEAQVAVEQAIEVIRAFYAKAAEGASLLQGKARAAQGVRQPYTGMQDSSGGVLGMLDVILSDFTRLETETSSSEDQAASAYDTYMKESTQDAEVKETEMDHKQAKKQQSSELLRSSKKELELTQTELDTSMTYYDKLKADCVDKGISYEERKRLREEEIQSLQEGLRILGQEALG